MRGSIVRRKDGTLYTLMRDNGPPPKRLAQSSSRDRGEGRERTLDRVGRPPDQVTVAAGGPVPEGGQPARPLLGEVELSHAIAQNALGGEQPHQAQELGLRQRAARTGP